MRKLGEGKEVSEGNFGVLPRCNRAAAASEARMGCCRGQGAPQAHDENHWRRRMPAAKKTTKTKTEGAIKGGGDRYHYPFAKVKKVAAGTGYSTAHGGVVEGDRMLV